MPPTPIAPKVFDFVDEAIEELTKEEREVEEPLEIDSPIREFCRTFYEQFFANVGGKPIKGINEQSGLDATLLLNDRMLTWDDKKRPLLTRFQHLCKIDGDICGRNKGGGEEIYRDFHEEFVIELIGEIEAWAKDSNQKELGDRASIAGGEYAKAVEKALEKQEEKDGDGSK